MVPFSKPTLGEEEAAAAKETILSGWVTQGPKVREFEDAFASYVGAQYACAVSSCTAALHIALLCVGVRPGDLVITVSHSFIATANSVRHCFAEPIFIDIERDTFNMEPDRLEYFLQKDCERRNGETYYLRADALAAGESPLRSLKGEIGRIAAIMPAHQMGMPCDIERIVSIARKHDLPVVEDAACAIGSQISSDGGTSWEKVGKPHGDMACFSFHPRKVITTGDGGMITTSNRDYDAMSRLLRHQGMSISDEVRHRSGKVLFEDYPVVGFNYRMTDIQAAIGLEQLKKLPAILSGRREISQLYAEKLQDIKWLKLPEEPDFEKTNWQSYPIRLLSDRPLPRNELMQVLLDNGVATRPGVMNSHEEAPYHNDLFDLPESERARQEVLLLPIFPEMQERDVTGISDILRGLRR